MIDKIMQTKYVRSQKLRHTLQMTQRKNYFLLKCICISLTYVHSSISSFINYNAATLYCAATLSAKVNKRSDLMITRKCNVRFTYLWFHENKISSYSKVTIVNTFFVFYGHLNSKTNETLIR